jgi:hypothetical protein
LAEDQDKLRLLESIHRAAEEWDGGGRPADLLVHRDGRLKDAEALITTRRFAVRPVRNEIPVVLVLGAVCAIAFWSFFGILEDVLTGDPLVRAGAAVFNLLQSLRTPFVPATAGSSNCWSRRRAAGQCC